MDPLFGDTFDVDGDGHVTPEEELFGYTLTSFITQLCLADALTAEVDLGQELSVQIASISSKLMIMDDRLDPEEQEKASSLILPFAKLWQETKEKATIMVMNEMDDDDEDDIGGTPFLGGKR